MAEITAQRVKELREKTGAGMMECKKALAESSGDLEKSIEYLRKRGLASASKKAGRLASEGLIGLANAGHVWAIVELNAETDFVAKTEGFKGLLQKIADHVVKTNPANVELLLTQIPAGETKTVDDLIKETVAQLGENISLRRFHRIEAGAGQKAGAYTHMGNKIISLVKLQSTKLGDEVLKDLAMHAAAVAPRFIRAEQIPAELKAKEKEIYLAQMQGSGKPAEILEKIMEGKLAKFATEICFEDQIFIKDPAGKLSVKKHLKAQDPDAEIIEFVRFQVGEGMAKKEEDFAAEVAKQVSSS